MDSTTIDKSSLVEDIIIDYTTTLTCSRKSLASILSNIEIPYVQFCHILKRTHFPELSGGIFSEFLHSEGAYFAFPRSQGAFCYVPTHLGLISLMGSRIAQGHMQRVSLAGAKKMTANVIFIWN